LPGGRVRNDHQIAQGRDRARVVVDPDEAVALRALRSESRTTARPSGGPLGEVPRGAETTPTVAGGTVTLEPGVDGAFVTDAGPENERAGLGALRL